MVSEGQQEFILHLYGFLAESSAALPLKFPHPMAFTSEGTHTRTEMSEQRIQGKAVSHFWHSGILPVFPSQAGYFLLLLSESLFPVSKPFQ